MLPDENKKLIRASFIDITERKRIEESLKQSEHRNSTILRTAMDGFWRVNPQGRLLEVNESYCRMSGYSEQELLGMSVTDLEAGESPDEVAAHMQTLVENGQNRFETNTGERTAAFLTWEVSVQYLPDEGGRSVAFLRDITERRRAEEDLRASEAHFHSLFNNMLNGYAYCRMRFEEGEPQDFIYLDVNGAFETFDGA